MPIPSISRHGENLHPDIVRGLQAPDGVKSVDVYISELNGHVYDRHQSVSQRPDASGMITEVFSGAISYSSFGVVSNLSGALLTAIIVSAAMPWGLTYAISDAALQEDLVSNLLFYFVLSIALFFTLVGGFFAIRIEMFRPANEPLIFDRQRRKVIAVVRDPGLGFSSFFKPSRWRVNEYDWDLVTAARVTQKEFTGATLRLAHELLLTVQLSHDKRAVIDGLRIGNPMIYVTSQRVDDHWEHLRRYMEDNGPPLPYNSLPSPIPPVKTLWQRLVGLTPFSAEYRQKWRNDAPFTLLCHLFAPFFLLWQLMGWLADQTRVEFKWSDELIEILGQPLDHAAIQQQNAAAASQPVRAGNAPATSTKKKSKARNG
ncbi:DUF6708 domain-containing protein [Chitinibacteraceae bacterium HSL-7]